MNGEMIITGYDKGDNIKAEIDGKPYVFGTTEWYGGMAIYGIVYPGEDVFTKLSKSRRAEKLYKQYANQITQYIEANPV